MGVSKSDVLAEFSDRRICHLFGIPVDALTMQQVLLIVDKAIERRVRLLVGVVNAAKVVNMRRDETLRRAVLSADLILADGMAVVWVARLLDRSLANGMERVTGIDLMHEMLRRSQERKHRVYCLGATDEVLRSAIARIHSEYPGVTVAGYRHGYFRPEEEPDVVAGIRAARPDILLVAMSPPKKEQFLARWSPELDVPVCHGVGGAFDVLAGKVQRAPERWRRLGLEWLYRVVQEPRRLWKRYLVTNTIFAGMVLAELLGRLKPSRRRSSGAGRTL